LISAYGDEAAASIDVNRAPNRYAPSPVSWMACRIDARLGLCQWHKRLQGSLEQEIVQVGGIVVRACGGVFALHLTRLRLEREFAVDLDPVNPDEIRLQAAAELSGFLAFRILEGMGLDISHTEVDQDFLIRFESRPALSDQRLRDSAQNHRVKATQLPGAGFPSEGENVTGSEGSSSRGSRFCNATEVADTSDAEDAVVHIYRVHEGKAGSGHAPRGSEKRIRWTPVCLSALRAQYVRTLPRNP